MTKYVHCVFVRHNEDDHAFLFDAVAAWNRRIESHAIAKAL